MSLPDGFARLHTDARHLLSRWSAPDQQQEGLRTAYLAHLDRHADATCREGPADHFTASMFVFDHPLERVLLVLHKKAHLWLQVGGHLEEHDAGIAQAAHREAVEESGLTDLPATPHLIHLDHHRLGSDFGRCRSHLDLRFATVAPPGAPPQVSAESDDIGWWPLEDLPTRIDPALPAVLHDAGTRLAADRRRVR